MNQRKDTRTVAAEKLAQLINDAHPDGLGSITPDKALPAADALARYGAALAIRSMIDIMDRSDAERSK